MERRTFLRLGLTAPVAALALPARATASDGASTYGPLLEPDGLGIQLPEGFAAREIARANNPVAGTGFTWHFFPDGGATFPTDDGGWIYVSNSEFPLAGTGGAGALRFDASGEIVDAYAILAGTQTNCAGGPTPWGTWLSAEEHATGRVWECDPAGEHPAVVHDALGVFEHEAAAVDPERRHVYLTEDIDDGGLYRFTPDRWEDLSAGVLEIAAVDDDGLVSWHEITDPSAADTPTRSQRAEATPFDGGEGIWYADGRVWFATTGDNRVWEYDTDSERLRVLYDAAAADDPVLTGVDNLVVTPAGEVLVAEDAGNMELVLVSADGTAAPFLRVVGQDESELAGPAFSPDGTRLYFSSQRGGEGGGTTYEVTGPFVSDAAAAPASVPDTLARAGEGGGGDSGSDLLLPVGVGVAGIAALGAAAAVWRLRTRDPGQTPRSVQR